MLSLDKILGPLQGLLAAFGVAEANRPLAALVLLYVVAVLLVIGLLLLVWRLRRRAMPDARPAPPPVSAPPGPEEAEPAAEEAAAEPPSVASESPAIVAKEEIAQPEQAASPGLTLFERMRAGLAKTQASVVGRLDSLLRGREAIDADLFEELEEILVTADFGVRTSQELIAAIESRISREGKGDPGQVRQLLREEIRLRLCPKSKLSTPASPPQVIMLVGVNGVGKTTTIGKLARQFADQGKKVVLGAGDTFRAAAAEQLAIWGERSGVDVIRHAEGSDPAAVAFDAAKAAVARQADVLLLDTAGRLHTKVNLMEELKKIRRVLAREIPGAPHETLLVLDATTGQNALSQARLFRDAVEVTGLVLSKLDGTAKGGIVVAIGAELGLPVQFVGIGEGVEDLRPFDPDLFVEALFPAAERP